MKKTTMIRASEELKNELKKMKKFNRESYEDIIRRIIKKGKRGIV